MWNPGKKSKWVWRNKRSSWQHSGCAFVRLGWLSVGLYRSHGFVLMCSIQLAVGDSHMLPRSEGRLTVMFCGFGFMICSQAKPCHICLRLSLAFLRKGSVESLTQNYSWDLELCARKLGKVYSLKKKEEKIQWQCHRLWSNFRCVPMGPQSGEPSQEGLLQNDPPRKWIVRKIASCSH